MKKQSLKALGCGLAAGAAFGVDELIKERVESGSIRIPDAGDPEVMTGAKGLLRYRYLRNTGVARGTFKNHPRAVALSSAALTMGVLGSIALTASGNRKGNNLRLLGMSLLLGGALSNTKDRLFRGYVVDYFSLNKGNKELKDLVWNLSDGAILGGALLATLSSGGKEKKSREKKNK